MDAAIEKKFEDQVEMNRLCHAYPEHPTEIFRAKSSVLYWRCTICRETMGPFTGSLKLLGKDGELEAERASKKRNTMSQATKELVDTNPSFVAGQHPTSLIAITQSLGRIEDRCARVIQGDIGDVNKRLDRIEKDLYEIKSSFIMLFDQLREEGVKVKQATQ